MYYFGTDLDRHGHYLWELESTTRRQSLTELAKLPFNVEALPFNGTNKSFKPGEARYYYFCGYSIYAIYGSCCDTRPNSKTIFFIREHLVPLQLKEKILTYPFAQKVIDKMSFKVLW